MTFGHSKPELSSGMSPRTNIHHLLLGIYCLGMIMFMPVMSALTMRRDSLFVYFVGHEAAETLLIMCSCIILVYVLVMASFFTRGRPESHDAAMLVVAGMFLTVLGLASILTSFPVRTEVTSVSKALYRACDGEGTYHELIETSRELQALRAKSACASMSSVEDCSGFKSTRTSEVLKHMEHVLGCSGFCYDVNAPTHWADQEEGAVATARAVAANVSMIEAHTSRRLHQRGRLLQRTAPMAPQLPTSKSTLRWNGKLDPQEHQDSESTAMLQVVTKRSSGGQADEKADHVAAGSDVKVYPPTLFSKANYQASCDGMSARHIDAYDTSAMGLFFSGIFWLVFGMLTNGIKLWYTG
jgi:hypothetical protein